MGKTLQYVQEEATGRLLFRRIYPVVLRPFLPEARRGISALKVPLGARKVMTADAFRTYDRANLQFEADLKVARAALQRHNKEQGARHDPLSEPLIGHLVEALTAGWHERDERLLRVRGGDWAERTEAGWEEFLDQYREWRAEGDLEAIEEHWGRQVDALLAEEGLLIDPADVDGRERLLWAVSAAALEYAPKARRRLAGDPVPVPVRPSRPIKAQPAQRTVAALIDAYRAAKWDRWSNSTRATLEPVFRVLRDALGDRAVTDVLRADARKLMELIEVLPANLGKRQELKGLSIPQAVERGKELGLPTIGPGTVNGGYMVHISAAFTFARQEQWIASNPFEGLSVHDPVSARDKRDPFTMDQLRTLFSSAPWNAPAPHDRDKPGAYWVPLIALFTGARLGEIAGLRIMDVEELEGIPALRIRPYEGHTIKNDGSRRDLPVHSELVRLGLLAFVAHRRAVAAPSGLLFPDGKANSRGQWGAKLGERFVTHLKALEITGTKLGIHSFRHNFEDRLRAAQLHGTAEGKALAGRQVAGSEAGYGSGFALPALQAALERVTYPGLDLTHLGRDESPMMELTAPGAGRSSRGT